jgi:hypothetical protein
VARGPETPHYTDCPVRDLRGCDWDHFSETGRTHAEREREGAIVEVLHMLTRHPEDYRIKTGKDPDDAAKEYAEQIRIWRFAL